MSQTAPNAYQPTPPWLDPAAWGGKKYATPIPLDVATLQGYLVQQLASTFTGSPVDVFGYPDLPDNSWWRGTSLGYILVAYDKTDFSAPMSTSAMVQERRVEFEVNVLARQIKWADMGPQGVFQSLLAVIRSALTGLSMPGFRNGYFVSESFREKSPEGKIWVYSMRFRAITFEIKTEPKVALAAFKRAVFLETGGISAIAVPATDYVFDFGGVIKLPQINISKVVVSAGAGIGARIYVEDIDYSVQIAAGTITALAGGALAPGIAVLVGYAYSDVVSAVKVPPGSATPTLPSN